MSQSAHKAECMIKTYAVSAAFPAFLLYKKTRTARIMTRKITTPRTTPTIIVEFVPVTECNSYRDG